MIQDPIVVRRVRGLLLISSMDSHDPVQLIRQTSNTELEVHLRNGAKYVQNVLSADEVGATILELLGYTQGKLVVTCEVPDPMTWDEADLKQLASLMHSRLFDRIPFLPGTRLIGAALQYELRPGPGNPRASRDDEHHVTIELKFWYRADMFEEVFEEAYDERYKLIDIALEYAKYADEECRRVRGSDVYDIDVGFS